MGRSTSTAGSDGRRRILGRMAQFNPPELRRLADFMAGLSNCPHGCDNGFVYNSPTFRVPTPGDTIDDQVTESVARYEREADGQLQRHLADEHRADAFLAIVEQAYRATRADVAAGWERIRHDTDVIAGHLTATLLPADLRAAGMRFEWEAAR